MREEGNSSPPWLSPSPASDFTVVRKDRAKGILVHTAWGGCYAWGWCAAAMGDLLEECRLLCRLSNDNSPVPPRRLDEGTYTIRGHTELGDDYPDVAKFTATMPLRVTD